MPQGTGPANTYGYQNGAFLPYPSNAAPGAPSMAPETDAQAAAQGQLPIQYGYGTQVLRGLSAYGAGGGDQARQNQALQSYYNQAMGKGGPNVAGAQQQAAINQAQMQALQGLGANRGLAGTMAAQGNAMQQNEMMGMNAAAQGGQAAQQQQLAAMQAYGQGLGNVRSMDQASAGIYAGLAQGEAANAAGLQAANMQLQGNLISGAVGAGGGAAQFLANQFAGSGSSSPESGLAVNYDQAAPGSD